MFIILSAIIISFAFFGESIFGLGGGFISIPLMSMILGVKDAVSFVLIFQLLMGILIIKTYKQVNWFIAIPMTISVIIGTILGTYMLSMVSDIFLRKFLAVTIFIFLIKMIFFQGFNLGKHPNKILGFITGLIGGWFQGITGTSSPIFTMYLATSVHTKSMMRATLIYIFFVTSIVRIIVSFSKGLINSSIISIALPTLPFFLLAIYLGHKVHTNLNENYYRYAIYCILFFSAISMILK